MNFIDEIKQTFSSNNAVKKIIVINVAMFIITSLFAVIVFLVKFESEVFQLLLRQLMLPASFRSFIMQPWSIITYMFLHSGFLHILFNMLWLFWIGNLLHEYLGNKKVYEAYFLGGVAGGLFYMICYNLFPAFATSVNDSFALGASAGVLSVVVATATLLPEYPFQLLFFGMVRLKWIAGISVLLDLISIPGGNSGGHLAHLGGAIFGFLYIKFLYQKNILPEWLFNPAMLFKKRSKVKIHYRTTYTREERDSRPTEAEVDAILDKISKSGYDSLSKKEKDQLFKASKE